VTHADYNAHAALCAAADRHEAAGALPDEADGRPGAPPTARQLIDWLLTRLVPVVLLAVLLLSTMAPAHAERRWPCQRLADGRCITAAVETAGRGA
jgi:hypothetical protein